MSSRARSKPPESLFWPLAPLSLCFVSSVFAWLPVSEGPPSENLAGLSEGFRFMLFMLFVLSIPVAIMSLPVIGWRALRARRGERLDFLGPAIALILGPLGILYQGAINSRIELAGLRAQPSRSRPLIEAIARYHDARKRYPDRLGDLVPDFLPSVPSTGMRGYPSYEYERFREDVPYDPGAVWYNLCSRHETFPGLIPWWPRTFELPVQLELDLDETGLKVTHARVLGRLPNGIRPEPFLPSVWRERPEERCSMITDLLGSVRLEQALLASVEAELGEPSGRRPLLRVPWELSIHCCGLFNTLHYWPTHEYSRYFRKKAIAEFDGWIFVHH
jgi:hypothetical protein